MFKIFKQVKELVEQVEVLVEQVERLQEANMAQNEVIIALSQEIEEMVKGPKPTVAMIAEAKFKQGMRIKAAEVLLDYGSYVKGPEDLERLVEDLFKSDDVRVWAFTNNFIAGGPSIEELEECVASEKEVTYDKMLHFICSDATQLLDVSSEALVSFEDEYKSLVKYPDDLDLTLLIALVFKHFQEYATDRELTDITKKLLQELVALTEE